MAKKGTRFSRCVPVLDLLRGQAAAADCLKRESSRDRLLAQVRELLGPHARLHCLEARLDDGVLALAVDSPSWATRVRYRIPELLVGLSDLGVSEIKLRVAPDGGWGRAARRISVHPPRLTPKVVDHLLQAAEGCVDPAMGEVLRRLARRQPGGAGGGAGGGLEI